VNRYLAAARVGWLVALVVAALPPGSAAAHCDGMDGPVVSAAQQALASGDVDLVMVWVRAADEPEIRRSFERALAVRKLGPEAQQLADLYFFETLVRVHRAGEGVAYTGLKPAGRDLGPAIPLADRVLASGDVAPLVELVTKEARRGLTERFREAVKARGAAKTGVEAGRAYVEKYVAFIHYAERAYEAAHQPAVGHYAEPGHAPAEH
jgi:hypothetical protein